MTAASIATRENAMDFKLSGAQPDIVAGVRALCQRFPDDYWCGKDAKLEVERYFRECRMLKVVPVSQEMVLNTISEHVLGLPRSY